MKTTKSIYKCGAAVEERTRALMDDTVVVRKSYENYIERKRIEGYNNLYKAIMKVKSSAK